MEKSKFIVPIIFLTMLYSCVSGNQKEKSDTDSFYTDKGGLDRPRIPLIKPYELLKVSADEWRMELFTTDVSLSIHNVKGVDVEKGKIFLHSKGGTDIRFKQYDEAWFIIDSSGKEEKAFLDYKRYTDTINKLGIEVFLASPETVYKSFYRTGEIKWE